MTDDDKERSWLLNEEQTALRGFQKEKFLAAGSEGTLGEIDKDARKRKWVASQEISTEGKEHEPKPPKNGQDHPFYLPLLRSLLCCSPAYGVSFT